MQHLRERFRRFDHARTRHHENIRGHGEHAMLLHGRQRWNPLPQRDHFALVLLRSRRPYPPCRPCRRSPRDCAPSLLPATPGIGGHGIAKHIFAARDFDHFVQVGRLPGDHQSVQPVRRSADDEHHAHARETRRPRANLAPGLRESSRSIALARVLRAGRRAHLVESICRSRRCSPDRFRGRAICSASRRSAR